MLLLVALVNSCCGRELSSLRGEDGLFSCRVLGAVAVSKKEMRSDD